MMNYTIAQTLSPDHFKRRFGLHQATFKQMLKVLKPQWRPSPKPGTKPKLELADRVLVALEYWREYRTYFHIGSSWGMHPNSRPPIKKPKGGTLTPAEKAKNQALAGERMGIEHVNRRFKIFRILAERDRNRRRRYGWRCNLIAALYNYELAQEA